MRLQKLRKHPNTDHCKKCGYISYPVDNGGKCPNCGKGFKDEMEEFFDEIDRSGKKIIFNKNQK